LFAVGFRVVLGGFAGVMRSMLEMAVRDVGMMRSDVVVVRFVVFGGLAMMSRGVFVVLGSFLVMLNGLF
jgi:hypothetical protein